MFLCLPDPAPLAVQCLAAFDTRAQNESCRTETVVRLPAVEEATAKGSLAGPGEHWRWKRNDSGEVLGRPNVNREAGPARP